LFSGSGYALDFEVFRDFYEFGDGFTLKVGQIHVRMDELDKIRLDPGILQECAREAIRRGSSNLQESGGS
jgi:hypothetical protein